MQTTVLFYLCCTGRIAAEIDSNWCTLENTQASVVRRIDLRTRADVEQDRMHTSIKLLHEALNL